MGIVAVLMAVGIPAFQNLGRTPAIDAATAQLRSSILLARQWAVTQRENTYVVFPMDEPDFAEVPSYAYRSFNVFTYSEGYLRDWTLLPGGLVFAHDNISADPRTETTNLFLWENEFIPADGFSLPQPNLIAYSDGSFPREPAGYYPEIRIMEGFLDSDGLPESRPGEVRLFRQLKFFTYGGGISVSGSN